jgi:hypothetical protein
MAMAADGAARAWLARCGLEGRYYPNADWAGTPVVATLEPRPSSAILNRRFPQLPRPFSAEWDGQIWLDRAGSRSFSLVVGGRAWLEVDGRSVLHATATGGLRQYSPTLRLEAGPHRLRLRYAPLGEDPRLDLAWQDGDGRPRPVPRQALSPITLSGDRLAGRRLAGGIALMARPLWVGGLAILLAALLGGATIARFAAALLVILGAFVLTGAPTLLWPELEVQRGRLLVALALYGVLAWLLLRALPALRRAGWRSAALGAVSLLIAVGAGEILLRTFRPDDVLPRFRWVASAKYHHINPPRSRMFAGRVGNAAIIVETNEDGLRTPYSPQSFRQHRVRVLVLGDSFAFGPGVAGEQTFPAQLERQLAQRGGPGDVAVLNAGVIGYSPYLEKLLFADLAERYRPTLVLLLLDATDIGDDDIYARLARPGEGGPSFEAQGEARLAYRGAVYELLRPGLRWTGECLAYPWALAGEALELLQGAGRSGFDYYVLPIEVEGQLDNRFFHYRHPLDVTRPFFEATLENVRAIAQRARASQARFALLVPPRYHHWSQREAPQNWERGGIYATDEPFQFEYFRFFRERRDALGFPVHDLLPAFQATDQFPLVFPNDPHWNEAGHAFVARTVADYLVTEGLLEP